MIMCVCNVVRCSVQCCFNHFCGARLVRKLAFETWVRTGTSDCSQMFQNFSGANRLRGNRYFYLSGFFFLEYLRQCCSRALRSLKGRHGLVYFFSVVNAQHVGTGRADQQ